MSVSQLSIPGIPRGWAGGISLDLPEGATVDRMLEDLGLPAEHRRLIKPFVNDKEASRRTTLRSGDRVFLFMAAGGG